MRKRTKKKLIKALVWLMVAVVLAVVGWFAKDALLGPTVEPVSGDEVEIHFIDVGQGDAALIRTAAGNVLIDTSTGSAEDQLKAYLDLMGVKDIEYAIFTHPDEDHIGGADMVLANYNVKHVILPDLVVSTAAYRNMDEGIKAEVGCVRISPEPDMTFKVGEVKFTVLAPLDDSYKDVNDHSVVLRMDYGETSILFTGDAEAASEKDMLERYGASDWLDCDILKVGHHGSKTSSSEAFLKEVTPDYAVISAGEGNRYEHPSPTTLDRLKALGIPYYRTDTQGNIVFSTTGGEPVLEAPAA